MANFNDILLQKLESKKDELTSKFQQNAEKLGWEMDLLSQVTVGPTSFNIPADLREKVEDAEYGGIEDRPRAAMRTFKPVLKTTLVEATNEAYLETLITEVPELFKK